MNMATATAEGFYGDEVFSSADIAYVVMVAEVGACPYFSQAQLDDFFTHDIVGGGGFNDFTFPVGGGERRVVSYTEGFTTAQGGGRIKAETTLLENNGGFRVAFEHQPPVNAGGDAIVQIPFTAQFATEEEYIACTDMILAKE